MSPNVSLLIDLAVTIPQALVAVAGVVLSLVVRNRLGKATVPATIGYAVLTLAGLFTIGVVIFDSQLTHLMASNHWSPGQVTAYTTVLAAISNLLFVAGLVVLVISTVMRRGAETRAAVRPTPAPSWSPPPAQPNQPRTQYEPGPQGQAPPQPPDGPSPY